MNAISRFIEPKECQQGDKEQWDAQPMQSQVIERWFPLPTPAVIRLMEEGGETTEGDRFIKLECGTEGPTFIQVYDYINLSNLFITVAA